MAILTRASVQVESEDALSRQVEGYSARIEDQVG